MVGHRLLERSRSAVRPRQAPHRVAAVADSRRPHELTLVVLGAPEVGKSAIVSQFLWDEFICEYTPTVEEFNWVEYDVGTGDELMLQVIDSSGSRDFLAMRHLYIRTGDVFLVVFSVDSLASFEEAMQIVDEIEERKKKGTPILLVANKTDLFEHEGEWAVKGAGQRCRQRGIPLMRITAKDGGEVSDAFTELLLRLRPDWHIATGAEGEVSFRKRRQSMPSTRYSAIDKADIEKIQQKHREHACAIM